MWFVIGLLSTIGCVVYFFNKKLKAKWKGTNSTSGNLNYQYYIHKNKNEIKGFKLGISSVGNFDFFIKLEKWHDRLFKKLGLSVEFQLGHPKFDKKFYIVSDDANLLQSIAQTGELHSAIDAAFESPKYSAHVKALHCHSERLWLDYRCEEGFSEGDVVEAAIRVVPLLKNVADHLAREANAGRTGLDRYAIRAAIILATSTGLAVNGLAHFVRKMSWSPLPFTIDTYQLAFNAVPVAIVIVIFLIFSTIVFLGRTSRAHLVFIEVLFIGSFGAFATSMEELSDLNMEIDSGTAQQIVLQINKKTIHHHRKSPDSYSLQVDDWINAGEQRRIDVTNSFYYQVREGEYIVIFQRPGYLGYRWVEDVKKAEASTENL